MNIAQMAMLPMKQMEGKKPPEGAGVLSRGVRRGVRQDKSTGDFSRVFDNTVQKTETGEHKTCQAENCQPNKAGKAQKQPVDDRPNQKLETVKSDTAETGNDAASLIQQIADILKLMGIPLDENVTLSENGGLVRENSNQQGQSGMIPEGPGVKEAVLRLINLLGKFNGNVDNSNVDNSNVDNSNVAPLMKELKGLTEAQFGGLNSLTDTQLSDLNTIPDEKFLSQLVKVLEKALGEFHAKKTDLAAATVVTKDQIPGIGIEHVSGNPSEKGVLESGMFADSQKMQAEGKLTDINSKGSETFGRDAGQNAKNGFSLHQSEIINPQEVRPVSTGNGFSVVTDALGNEQPASGYKLTQSIFSQITQKARVIVLPGVTEMQIQLKPGFLGKLNMSISSENGTVTARFSAETQAVKGIIEANLNSLKDTLNQQGIKVDQLLVDVGTNNHQPGFEQRQNMYRGHNAIKNNRVSISSEEVDRIFSAENQSGALKGYYGSTVEFTA